MKSFVGLRQQTSTLTSQLEEERERYHLLEAKMRTNDASNRASQLVIEDERLRNDETTKRLQSQVLMLEEKLQSLAGNGVDENTNSPGGKQELKDKKISEMEEQIRTLSTQLLKKQGWYRLVLPIHNLMRRLFIITLIFFSNFDLF